MNKIIAVVDDEPDIVELITLNMQREGFTVRGFSNGEDLLSYLNTSSLDLVILDLMLPDIDGLEICHILKKDERTASLPIIMLTAKGTETDRVVGLELGADDYIVKPFSLRELLARVKTVLRRTSSEGAYGEIIRVDDVEVDPLRFEVRVGDRLIGLTPTEFRILEILAKRKGKVLSRNRLLELLWEGEKVVMDRTIDVHVRRLREKLGETGEIIKTVRGVGYKVEA